jgi:hypothetical protein
LRRRGGRLALRRRPLALGQHRLVSRIEFVAAIVPIPAFVRRKLRLRDRCGGLLDCSVEQSGVVVGSPCARSGPPRPGGSYRSPTAAAALLVNVADPPFYSVATTLPSTLTCA